MKKWITGIVVAMMLAIIVVFIILPSTITITEFTQVKCPEAAAVRMLGSKEKWEKWWPSQEGKEDLIYKGIHYQLSKVMYNAYDVIQAEGSDSINSQMVLLRVNSDSLLLQWEATSKTTSNPFLRISNYFKAKKIKRNMQELLNTFNSYVQDVSNIYGFKISIVTLKDTMLITRKFTSVSKPTTSDIYSAINALSRYAIAGGAKSTNYPMLNVRKSDSGYVCIVAIPVDKRLEETKTFIPKRMPIIKDNTLYVEVKGGENTVQRAFEEIAIYMQDHHYGSPALPFESLVTDRNLETDTTKWITHLYVPIM